jgi:ATP-binding cassette, subfamily B, multidrug efflux pump
MFKLRRYMKPFIHLIAAAVVLLFIQAMADLTLPDYMSNIVNTGIQQSGIENAVPKAMRADQMDKLTLFLTEEEKSEVLSSYTFINKNSSDNEKYLKSYPVLESEPIYILDKRSKDVINKLNPIMGRALLSTAAVERMMVEAAGGEIVLGDVVLPGGTDLFALLSSMTNEQRTSMMQSSEEEFALLDDRTITQFATAVIQTEYTALGVNIDRIQSSFILRTGVYMLLVSLVGAAATIAVGFLAARTAAGLSRNLRRDVFTKIESFSNAEFDKFSTASLITRTTNDITQIQMVLVMGVRMLIYAPIMGIGGIIKAVDKSASMSWIIALAVVILLSLIGSVFVVAMPKFKLIQKLVDRLNLVTRENLSGMMVIRAFNTQSFEEKRFDKANQDLTDNNLFVNRVMVIVMPAIMFIMNGATLLVVWVGAHHIEKSAMQVGDMMAFMQYAMQIIFAFLMMSFMLIMVPRASVSAGRVSEVLEVEPTILDPVQPKHFTGKGHGIIEFRNVSFRYPGAEEDMLKDINFKALPGQTTAFIGSTGSGKTTLVNLIPRFYDVTQGSIIIDGVDIREVTQQELRHQIGYIPQKGSLFKGTIKSNLKYADENASEHDMVKVVEVAQAMEFIEEKEEGFDSQISQGGTNVSGGQKQRLSIARALVKKPKVYIFDDSFSALDFKTDAALRRALKNHTASSTVLIVAQRVSTIKNAEQIIVLDEGRIVGVGTHNELLSSCETYQEITLSQFSKEELA